MMNKHPHPGAGVTRLDEWCLACLRWSTSCGQG